MHTFKIDNVVVVNPFKLIADVHIGAHSIRMVLGINGVRQVSNAEAALHFLRGYIADKKLWADMYTVNGDGTFPCEIRAQQHTDGPLTNLRAVLKEYGYTS